MEDKKREILEKLNRANKELAIANEQVSLVIVGGSAFILQGLIDRATEDIDYLNNDYNKKENVRRILLRNEINSDVVTFDSTFGDWRDDVIELKQYEFTNISLLSISIERLLTSRVFSRRRWDDIEVVFGDKTVDIDQDKFEEILFETLSYCVPVFETEFKDNVFPLMELYKVRGWDETKITKKLREW